MSYIDVKSPLKSVCVYLIVNCNNDYSLLSPTTHRLSIGDGHVCVAGQKLNQTAMTPESNGGKKYTVK